MTREEFTSRTTKPITDRDFARIQMVYTFHPCIDAVKGKDQIANLYEAFGMRIIEDMMPTAKKAEELERKMREAKRELERLTEEYEGLKKGK